MVSVLRQLPYIRQSITELEDLQGALYSNFANWKGIARSRELGQEEDDHGLHVFTEHHLWDSVPADVIGLVIGGRNSETILLNIEYGIIYWIECSDGLRENTSQELIEKEDWAWVPETEANWWDTEGSPAWTIADFFEMLKDQFHNLRFIPANNRQVFETWKGYDEDGELGTTLRMIFREHGCPDLERYRKAECIKAVEKVTEEKFPDELGW